MKSRGGFCFTINSFDEDTETWLQDIDAQYIVYGYEIAPTTGRPHFQGYVYFHNPRSVEAVYKEFARKGGWATLSNGDPLQNYDYTTKDGQYFEKGIRPVSDKAKGEAERDRWRNTLQQIRTSPDLSNIPPDIYIRYHSTIKRIRNEEGPRKELQMVRNLFPWQESLLTELSGVPHSRRVIWYYDLLGGKGKTEMAKYLAMNKNAQVFGNAKTPDIAYALNDDPGIVIFDYSRSTQDLNYEVIEAVKNGMIFSTKYESRMKLFKTPHVVIFSNIHPDMTKLSEDRWDIRRL